MSRKKTRTKFVGDPPKRIRQTERAVSNYEGCQRMIAARELRQRTRDALRDLLAITRNTVPLTFYVTDARVRRAKAILKELRDGQA